MARLQGLASLEHRQRGDGTDAMFRQMKRQIAEKLR
jgi:hypothetical protein